MISNKIPKTIEAKNSSLIGKKRSKKENSPNEASESDSSFYSSSSDLEENSLMKEQYKQNIKEKYIQVLEIKTGNNQNIEVDKVAGAIETKDVNFLNKFAFPYKTLNYYNNKYITIDTNTFRKLNFFCPICKEQFRHYSIYYHVFQFHFNVMKDHLTQRDIARSCSKLLDKEYEKIKNSIELFSELATLFNSCNFRGYSQWRNLAEKQIIEIKNLNIEKLYFDKTVENAIKNLNNKLPINGNKNKTKKRTFKKWK